MLSGPRRIRAVVFGGAGNDSIADGDSDADRVDGGAGDDDLIGGDSAHSLADGLDCETFDGGRAPAGVMSVSLPVACPGGCTSGRIVLTVAGKRLGEGKVGRGVARVRFNRRLAKGRKVRVRATIVARDSAGRTYRSRGRYELRAG